MSPAGSIPNSSSRSTERAGSRPVVRVVKSDSWPARAAPSSLVILEPAGGSICSLRQRLSNAPPYTILVQLDRTNVASQPVRPAILVGERWLAETKRLTHLRPVVLDRPPGPVIARKVSGGDADCSATSATAAGGSSLRSRGNLASSSKNFRSNPNPRRVVPVLLATSSQSASTSVHEARRSSGSQSCRTPKPSPLSPVRSSWQCAQSRNVREAGVRASLRLRSRSGQRRDGSLGPRTDRRSHSPSGPQTRRITGVLVVHSLVCMSRSQSRALDRLKIVQPDGICGLSAFGLALWAFTRPFRRRPAQAGSARCR